MRGLTVEEALAYFRLALTDPLTVPPWSEWWAANAETVERVFPLVEFVRLKHRRLKGARQMLQLAGELPKDFTPPDPLMTGSCNDCGDRFVTTPHGRQCPLCGLLVPPEAT